MMHFVAYDLYVFRYANEKFKRQYVSLRMDQLWQ